MVRPVLTSVFIQSIPTGNVCRWATYLGTPFSHRQTNTITKPILTGGDKVTCSCKNQTRDLQTDGIDKEIELSSKQQTGFLNQGKGNVIGYWKQEEVCLLIND